MAGRVSLPARLHGTGGRFTPCQRRNRGDRLRRSSPDRPATLDSRRLLQEFTGVRSCGGDQVGGLGPGPDRSQNSERRRRDGGQVGRQVRIRAGGVTRALVQKIAPNRTLARPRERERGRQARIRSAAVCSSAFCDVLQRPFLRDRGRPGLTDPGPRQVLATRVAVMLYISLWRSTSETLKQSSWPVSWRG